MKDEKKKLEGILLVDKPSEWTSHDVCNFIKKRFKVSKVGHTGTLDPQATGVLVLLLGGYTKLSARFTNCEKQYSGTIELGVSTTTQDGDGEVVERKDWRHIRPEQVQGVFRTFMGPQKQIPPMISAIRSGGVRLYKLARKGYEVKRKKRDIFIYDIKCDKIDLPYIDFTIVSSKGTYIRTVAHDIGEKLGVGAYLKNLCRMRNGSFHINDCVEIDALKRIKTKDELSNYVQKDFSYINGSLQ